MEIQKTNNSPSFEAIKISTKEGRKIAQSIRAYKQTQSSKALEDLVDTFRPHIEKEAELLPENISKQDFIQRMYLYLIENVQNISTKFHPSADLVKKMNEGISIHPDDVATLGHKSIDTLTQKEYTKFAATEQTDIIKDVIDAIENDTKYFTPRDKFILTQYLSRESLFDIGYRINLGQERLKQIIQDRFNKFQTHLKLGHIKDI